MDRLLHDDPSGAERPTRPRVIVLQHSERAPLGALEAVLHEGAELLVYRLCEGGPDEAAACATLEESMAGVGYDGLIALGGTMGLYERERFPCLEVSLRVIADAVRRDVPILGLGLGSQVLAEALGAPVFSGINRGIPQEMGFMSLYLTRAGGSDPVMRIFGVNDPQLFWHRDTHDVPDDAEHLASTSLYQVAAFRWGRWAYGLQFHLEATAEMVERWVAEDEQALVAQGIDPASVVAQAWMLDEVIEEKARRLGGLFLEWARERSPR